MYYTIIIFMKSGTELKYEYNQSEEGQFTKIKDNIDNHHAFIAFPNITIGFKMIKSIKLIYAKKQDQESPIFAELRSYYFL